MNSNTKILSVVAYISWIGWIISLLLRDKTDSIVRQHLNQALILNVVSIVCGVLNGIGGYVGYLGGLLSIAVLVFAIWGIVRAIQGSEEPLPLVGNFTIIQ